MKKLLVAILAFLYIGTSSGAIVHMHYCMGKLADWGLGHQGTKTCGKCGMKKSATKYRGCCKDEQKFIKNQSDQKVTESAFQIAQVIAVALPVPFFELASADISTITEKNPVSHAPPRKYGIAIYLSNCIFLL